MENNDGSVIKIDELYSEFKSEFENGNITIGGSILYNALGILNSSPHDIDLVVNFSDYTHIVKCIYDYCLFKNENVKLNEYNLKSGHSFSISGMMDIFVFDFSPYKKTEIVKINDSVCTVFYGYEQLESGILQTIEMMKELGFREGSGKIKKMQKRLALIKGQKG